MTRRRGRGEGSIYQRADGYWVGAVDAGRTASGKRRRLRVVRKAKADVIAALPDLRRRDHGSVPDRSHTLETFLAFWLDEVIAPDVQPETLRDYRKRVARITAVIGHIRLGSLTKPHVQRLAGQLADDYAPRTRNSTLATLRQALRWAVPDLIAWNPAEGVRGPKTPVADVDDTLTPDEINAVLAAAAGDRLGALVWFAVKYGLRQGELIRLRWADIDADEMSVRKAKTPAGVRTLPLIAEAKRVLAAHRRRAGVAALDGRVFTTAQGWPLTPHRVVDYWNDVLERAGVAHLCRSCGSDEPCSGSVRRFHSSRHTAATALLEAGVPLEVVTAILGHSHIGITAGMYAKVRADLKRRGLNQLS